MAVILRQRHRRARQQLVGLFLRYTPVGPVCVFSVYVLLGDGGGVLAGLPSLGPG